MTRTRQLTTLILIAGALLLVAAGTAHAKPTAEQKCQKGRYDAAAKYSACQQKAMAKLFGADDFTKFQAAAGKCHVKYTDTWAKLQAKASGTGVLCDNDRYDDTGDGTVTDRLTGLQWEQKTEDASVHDKDNSYSWSATPPYTAADGTAFTSFLTTLNSGGCFAGQCDWRLPTVYELQTILLGAYPCATSPCIDDTAFGPTAANPYWSATTLASNPDHAWYVYFGNGDVLNLDPKGYPLPRRAPPRPE